MEIPKERMAVELRPGTRLQSVTSSTEVIVVRASTEDPLVACGGLPMVQAGAVAASTASPQSGHDEATLLGKRYVDEDYGLELLCTKAGSGTLTCAGRIMRLKEPKPLPSSD
jgi:hypothetical protein